MVFNFQPFSLRKAPVGVQRCSCRAPRTELHGTSEAAAPELAPNTSCRNIKLYKKKRKRKTTFPWSPIPHKGFKKSPLNEKDAMRHQYLNMDML